MSNDNVAVLPHSMEAEHALLGAVIYNNGALEFLPDGFGAAHFYEPFHQRLFASLNARVNAGAIADITYLVTTFKDDPSFAVFGGLQFFADLIDHAPPASHAADHARLIMDEAKRRQLLTLSADMASGVHDRTLSAADHIETYEAALFEMVEREQGGQGFRDFSEVVAASIGMAAEAYSRDGGLAGLSTGLIDLDRLLGGLHPSDLIILAGRPSMGKSALAANIAFHAASRGVPSGFYSLEMSAEQLGLRVLADAASVPGDKIRKGEISATEFGRLRDASMEVSAVPLYIDDTGGLSLGKLAARARRLKRRHGLGLVVVDYLQLLTTGRASSSDGRVQEVSAITMGLKALAKELHVPVLALSQLSRQVEMRADKRPQLSDLRESGSIEQDADMVLFVYREEYYLSRAEPREGTNEHFAWCDAMSKAQGMAEVIIGKQRHGPIGTVKLAFNSDLTKFGNMARDDRYPANVVDFSEARGRE